MHQVLALEFAQLRRKNFFTHAGKQSTQFAKTPRSVGEMPHNLDFPFAGEGICSGLHGASEMMFHGFALLQGEADYKIVRTYERDLLMLASRNSAAQGEDPVATHLSSTEMKKLVREHFEDFVNRRKPEVIRQNMTPDFLDHDGPGGKPTGVAGDENMMRAMYEKMADLRIEILDCLADGDKVACRNIWRWTDPGSGKSMEFHGFVLWRFEGAKIAERWATVSAPAAGSEW